MSERLIHPEDYPIPHPPLVAFIRANGLDEHDIPAAAPLVIEGGRLTVTEFVFQSADGPRFKVLEPGGESYVKTTRTVPLVSPPEAHGL